MVQNVSIDTDALHRATSMLRAEARSLLSDTIGGMRPGMAGFSQAAGFREAGRSLNKVSSFHAPEAFRVMAAQLNDTADVAESNLSNVVTADGIMASAFRSIGAQGEHVLGDGAGHIKPAHPGSVKKSTPITTQPPIVTPPANLRLLERLMSASRVSAAVDESAYWNQVAHRLDASVHSLFGVRQQFATSLDTAWVRRADERVSKIQRAASMYATRARAMSMHTTALATTTSAETAFTAAAAAVAAALPIQVRPVYETTFLMAFGPRASAELTTTLPAFSKLYPDLDRISGNPFRIQEVQQPHAPSFNRSPLPEMIRESFVAIGHADLAHATTPHDVVRAYGQVNPDVVESIRAGATQTQVASIAAPSMPPSLQPGLPATMQPTMQPSLPTSLPPVAAVMKAGGIGTAAAGLVGTAIPSGLTLPTAAAERVAEVANAQSSSSRGLAAPTAGGSPASPTIAQGLRAAAPVGAAGATGAVSAARAAAATPQQLAAAGSFGAGPGGTRSYANQGTPSVSASASGSAPRGSRGTSAQARASDAAVSPAALGTAPASTAGLGRSALTRSTGLRGASVPGSGTGGRLGAVELGTHAVPHAGAHSMAVPGMTGATGAAGAHGSMSGAGAMGFMGASGMPGANAGAGIAPGMVGAPGAHGPGGAGGAGAAPSGSTSPATPHAGAHSGSRPVVAGGAPVAGGRSGAGGAGNGGKRKRTKATKVQAVTSAVERDGNLQELLGEAPLVLPSVIGHNVR